LRQRRNPTFEGAIRKILQGGGSIAREDRPRASAMVVIVIVIVRLRADECGGAERGETETAEWRGHIDSKWVDDKELEHTEEGGGGGLSPRSESGSRFRMRCRQAVQSVFRRWRCVGGDDQRQRAHDVRIAALIRIPFFQQRGYRARITAAAKSFDHGLMY